MLSFTSKSLRGRLMLSGKTWPVELFHAHDVHTSSRVYGKHSNKSLNSSSSTSGHQTQPMAVVLYSQAAKATVTSRA